MEQQMTNNLSDKQIDVQLDKLSKTPLKKRVWEIDFLRGLMILFVVFDHFMWDVKFSGGAEYNTAVFRWLYDLSSKYYRGVLRETTHDTFVMMFVLVSGISCSFSRNNFNRAIKMIVFAILLTVVTMLFDMTVYFNVIHVLALCTLIYCLFEKVYTWCKKQWAKDAYGIFMFVFTVAVLMFGYCLQYVCDNFAHLYKDPGWIKDWITSDNKYFFFLFEHNNAKGFYDFTGSDYLAFLPAFGWFLLGAGIGKLVYKDKTSLLPNFNEKLLSPFIFCGKYSIWVYFGSQGIMYLFFYLLHVTSNIL